MQIAKFLKANPDHWQTADVGGFRGRGGQKAVNQPPQLPLGAFPLGPLGPSFPPPSLPSLLPTTCSLCFSQLSSALLFDAVYAVVTAVQELNRSQEIGVKPLSCGSAQIWQHGTSLMNYLRMVRSG